MTGSSAGITSLILDIVSCIPEGRPGRQPSREAIASIAALIAERFRPERIVLYGSRVYGKPRRDSDVDLMVVMDPVGPATDPASSIREAIPAGRIRFDVKVRTPAEIRLGLAEGDFFIEDVILKGITLYATDGPSMTGGSRADGGDGSGSTPGLKQATRDWLDKAEADFRAAKRLIEPPD